MIKGCQRRVVFLRDTGSELFDEAYFIVGSEGAARNVGEDEMLAEARRILNEKCVPTASSRKKAPIFVPLLCFFAGLCAGVGAALLFPLI